MGWSCNDLLMLRRGLIIKNIYFYTQKAPELTLRGHFVCLELLYKRGCRLLVQLGQLGQVVAAILGVVAAFSNSVFVRSGKALSVRLQWISLLMNSSQSAVGFPAVRGEGASVLGLLARIVTKEVW